MNHPTHVVASAPGEAHTVCAPKTPSFVCAAAHSGRKNNGVFSLGDRTPYPYSAYSNQHQYRELRSKFRKDFIQQTLK